MRSTISADPPPARRALGEPDRSHRQDGRRTRHQWQLLEWVALLPTRTYCAFPPTSQPVCQRSAYTEIEFCPIRKVRVWKCSELADLRCRFDNLVKLHVRSGAPSGHYYAPDSRVPCARCAFPGGAQGRADPAQRPVDSCSGADRRAADRLSVLAAPGVKPSARRARARLRIHLRKRRY